ncbi:MAG: aspartate ammonia-lyase [Candidatus Omnitrophica bacterium]|nr:aspartate ammonia-lyase [Candidatus Omnitrophota bacterium]
MEYRTEKDNLGEKNIPKDCLWGIHTQRALENFRVSSDKMPCVLIRSLAFVKKACCMANLEKSYITKDKAEAIIKACDEIIEFKYIDFFPLDALQGGAGTSANMNMNEVIANRALEIMDLSYGEYSVIDPIRDINMHQSTNDVYPTAVKLAVLEQLKKLSVNIEFSQGVFQKKEKEFADIIKTGRTELQEAVPLTLGAEFSAFAEAIARDRWRVFKCEERIRSVNLGGTAVGTGLTAPRGYIFIVTEKLRELTGLGLARGENLVDQTANSDSFVEVAGILKAHASNIIKISNDLRLMNLLGEISLAPVQAGSSIMPGKVNPVILESAVQGALKVFADCNTVFETTSRASFQINEFMPLLAFSILDALDILININVMLANHLKELKANKDICEAYVSNSILIITAFVPHIGYERCEKLLKEFLSIDDKKISFKDFLTGKLGCDLVGKVLSPQALMSLGYREDGKNT